MSNFNMKLNTTPVDSEISLEDWSSEEEVEENSACSSVVVTLPRTLRLILDYKQFKAAQLIQRHIRGWLVRTNLRKLKLATVVIQKWWRRYMAQKNLIVVAETKLQLAVVQLYNLSATLIQKVFRGWWYRKQGIDMRKLRHLQMSMSEYIIRILGNCLNELKDKAMLPGVRIRLPQKCNETIEQLVSTFDYRIYNGRACYRMEQTKQEINDLRNSFKVSADYTNVPFRGFDYKELCERHVSSLEVVEQTPEAIELIRKFVAGKADMNLKSKYIRKSKIAASKLTYRLDKKTAFFKRITRDMKKWHNANGDKVLPKEIFKNTDMKVLLEEAQENLEDIFGRLGLCICGASAEIADN
ncbi:uncharacterized protein [Drosophila kikkawai]|uniref:Uncharacterized protein isoform X2 n=1 Tax=Drosophila kikkawai TaxID=30033 RepID=A0A6P4I7C4_DROKI|nr:uncharacterized protein LOC108075928 isoform X2 [Drosophila kikkawai]